MKGNPVLTTQTPHCHENLEGLIVLVLAHLQVKFLSLSLTKLSF
jgi:hypothetical protein